MIPIMEVDASKRIAVGVFSASTKVYVFVVAHAVVQPMIRLISNCHLTNELNSTGVPGTCTGM